MFRDPHFELFQVVLPVGFDARYLAVTSEDLDGPQVVAGLEFLGDHDLPDAQRQVNLIGTYIRRRRRSLRARGDDPVNRGCS